MPWGDSAWCGGKCGEARASAGNSLTALSSGDTEKARQEAARAAQQVGQALGNYATTAKQTINRVKAAIW